MIPFGKDVYKRQGYTAQCFPALDGVNVVCIPHAYGFKEPGKNELTDETLQQLREKGLQVYASSHALSGAERGITGKFGGVAPVEIIAHTLRFFGQGMKVCVEIAAMAADGGFIPPDVYKRQPQDQFPLPLLLWYKHQGTCR